MLNKIYCRIEYCIIWSVFSFRFILCYVKKAMPLFLKLSIRRLILHVKLMMHILITELKIFYVQHIRKYKRKYVTNLIPCYKNRLNKIKKKIPGGDVFKSLGVKGILYARKHNIYIYTRITDLIKKQSLSDINILRITKPFPYANKRYKPFDIVGDNVKIGLRGGDFMTANDAHTILTQKSYISGSIQGVAHKKKLISIIETKGMPKDFGCFNNKMLVFLNEKIIFVLRFLIKRKRKVIFIGANNGYLSNYFHFAVDVLPSLLCSMSVLRAKEKDWQEFVVLIPTDVNNNIRQIILKCCVYYGYESADLKPLDWINCEKVVMTGYASFMKNPLPVDTNYCVSPALIRFTRKILREVFANEIKDDVKITNLYVTRENASGTSSNRHVLNYKLISEQLLKENFITINTSKLTLHQQINYFNNAEIIVIDGGAAIANLIFAKRCKKVIVLAMSEGTDPSVFASLAQSLGIDICYLCGKAQQIPLIPSWHLPYEINLYQLHKYVYKLLSPI